MWYVRRRRLRERWHVLVRRDKIGFARALVKNPEIILFDEPLSNIDEERKREYRHLIVRTKQMFPESTYLYVTHNLPEAISMSNKLLIMDEGRVIQYGNVRQVFEYPNCRLVLEALHQNVSYKDCVISGGHIVMGEESRELSLLQQTGLINDGNISAVCASYDGYVSCFDEQGNALIGVLDKVSIPVRVDAQDIYLLGNRYSSEWIAEGLLDYGCGIAVLRQQYFTFEETPGSIKMEGTIVYCDEFYICCQCGSELRMFLPNSGNCCVGQDIVLYYPFSELEIYDRGGKKMLSQYALTGNVLDAKVVSADKGVVKIGKHKLRLNQTLWKKTVKLQISREAFSFTDDKKRGIKVFVLNEEYCNGQTLVYAEIEDKQNYLVMCFDGRVRCFAQEANYVAINPDEVRVLEQH